MIRAKFRVNTRQVRENIQEKVILVQKKTALELLTSIVDMTPVDTGRARGNWQVAIGQPNYMYSEDSFDRSGNETKALGEAAIQSLTTLGAIYLTNNLPYILELEKGHSKQAPVGMVEVSLDRVMAKFR